MRRWALRSVVRIAAVVAGVVAMVLSTLTVVAGPAEAVAVPAVSIKPGETVVVSRDSFPAGVFSPYSLGFAYSPDNCTSGEASVWCDTVPIRLLDADGKPLSQKRLDSGLFALSLKLEWPTENVVIPGTGIQPLTQLNLAVWDDPVVEDDDAPPECDPSDPLVNFYLCFVLGPAGGNPGGDEAYYDCCYAFGQQPQNFGLVPTRNAYAATVAMNLGAGVPYKLKLTFIETPTDLVDLSIDEIIEDLSGSVTVPPLELGGSTLPDLTSGGAGFDLTPADIGINADLDAIGSEPGLDLLSPEVEEFIRSRGIRELRPAGKASPWLLILWLVVLPARSLAGAVWFLRRRASIFNV